MRIGLIEAVWGGTALEGKAGAEAAREIGYESVDLIGDPLELTDEQVAQIKADVDEVGIPVAGAICVALGITDFNRSVQRFHTDRAKLHVDFAAEVGASNLLMVIGDYIWKKEVIPPEEQWDTAVSNVREVARHAESLGIEIALELEPYEWSYVNSIDEMVRFLDAVGVEAMKANADLNHLWPMRIEPHELERLSGRVAHAHISDTHGDVYENLTPGRGTAPLAEYCQALVDTGFDGTIAVELGSPPDGVDVREWVAEGYTETKRLLDGAANSR